jgi:sigma-B regulation protein RsbU (phosphoserine phosphatase)
MSESRCSSRGSLWIVGLFVLNCASGSSTAENAAEDTERAAVATALEGFARELEIDLPTDAVGVYPRIQSYLEANPDFYGSAVAMLDAEGTVTASPYVYRSNDGLEEVNLATPDYQIDEQEWLAMPRDSKEAIWTDPYFDEGGGEIWMVTRAVPLIRDDRVVLVVTTDLPVDAPMD